MRVEGFPRSKEGEVTSQCSHEWWSGLDDNIRIAVGAVVEDGVEIGEGSFIGSNAVIRKGTKIGSNCCVGPLTMIEESVEIGDDTRIQASCYITKFTKIGGLVFIGPSVVTINEWRISSHGRKIPQRLEGALIEDKVRIGAGSLIMPGIRIGENALIGAGSLVAMNVPDKEIWFGHPAKKRGRVPEPEIL